MLFIFLVFLISASIMVLIVKRNWETFYLFAMCISLATMLTGVLIYIAKKGGISRELQNFFYFNLEIKTKVQYFLITLGELGYLIAIGRFLFPMFLLLFAIHYSMVPWVRRSFWLNKIVVLIPVISLIAYHPTVFNYINTPDTKVPIFDWAYWWIIAYMLFALYLLLYEALTITMKMFRRQFFVIVTFILSITLLYALYFKQDPSQVYQFYTSQSLGLNGIYYMDRVLSVPLYTLIVIVNIIGAIIGFASLLKYTQEVFQSSKQGEIIKYQSEAVNMGTSVFVHGIKNQLLANRVIHKRIDRLYDEETKVSEEVKGHINQLLLQNENMLERVEELYNAVKTNQVHLVAVELKDVINEAVREFDVKEGSKKVIFNKNIDTNAVVLADKVHLSEAINNLLSNAYDAVDGLGEKGVINLKCYSIRLYNVVEVSDNGIGISKGEMKKVFDPFYSNKNSNSNWGMGLYYVHTIIHEHYGTVKLESKQGSGTKFYILLPKYK